MAVVTIYRLAEEISKLLNGGNVQVASNVTLPELKITIGQVANQLLKTDYFQLNEALGEKIPNGSVLGLYEGIQPTSWVVGRSKATLPIKPLKLPRNMGVFSVFRTNDPSNEFIPLQMGQYNLLKSQVLINDLLGQIGYEVFGMELIFTKDIPQMYPGETLSMRLAIMDISQYSDYDPLPILPEMEWEIKRQVVALYSQEPITDKLVDPSNKNQQKVPVKEQQQT